jgi:hypothetical protein
MSMRLSLGTRKKIKQTARNERKKGAQCIVDNHSRYITVKTRDGYTFCFRDCEAEEILLNTPENISHEDYILWLIKEW